MKETLNYVEIINLKVKVINAVNIYYYHNFSNKNVERRLYWRNKRTSRESIARIISYK